MKRLLFIYNPMSGQGKVKANLSDMVDIFVKAGYEVTCYPTQASRDAVRKAEADSAGYDLVVASGGDGTLDEVVTGIMRAGSHVPIGYIPAGSTNDYGNSLGIDKHFTDAAQIAATGQPYTVDVGGFGDGYFIYVAAFGIFTKVSYATPQDKKNAFGHGAYLFEAAKELKDIPSYMMQVEYDGNVVYDDFIYGMITNSKSVGGMTGIIPGDINLNDGVFEVNLVKNPKNPIELSEIVAYLTGTRKESTLVYSFQTSELRLKSADEIPWTVDGEYGGSFTDLTIRNLHNAVSIMVEKDPDAAEE